VSSTYSQSRTVWTRMRAGACARVKAEDRCLLDDLVEGLQDAGARLCARLNVHGRLLSREGLRLLDRHLCTVWGLAQKKCNGKGRGAALC